MATLLTKKRTRAVWKDDDREEEIVVPLSWIEGKIVRWLGDSSAVAALTEKNEKPGSQLA